MCYFSFGFFALMPTLGLAGGHEVANSLIAATSVVVKRIGIEEGQELCCSLVSGSKRLAPPQDIFEH